MDKIKMSRAEANAMQLTEKLPHYDAVSKKFLSHREFLAVILKHVAREYAGMSYEDIAACIEPDSIKSDTEVSPAGTTSSRITGDNSEFSVQDEVMSRFDILFKAVNPGQSDVETTYCLHINFEPQNQNNCQTWYPIEKRCISHGTMMLSSQIPVHTDGTDYDCLQKVYTIFICREKVPKSLQNTMSVFEIKNTFNNRDITPENSTYDLMTTVIIRLGNPRYDLDEIFNILNALFYPREQEANEKLMEYIDFSKELTMEVKKMSGLGESIFIDGVEEGEGKKEKEIVMTMIGNGIQPEEIAKMTGIPIEKIEGNLPFQ